MNRNPLRDPLATMATKPDKNGLVRYYRPTQKQLKLLQGLNRGLRQSEAMRAAGYSPASVNVSTPKVRRVLESLGTDKMIALLEKRKLGLDKMADKMVEWIDAKKTKVTKNFDDKLFVIITFGLLIILALYLALRKFKLK